MGMVWPLATNSFNLWDRLKIAWFFLKKKNRWTQDKYVRQYEEAARKYVGCKHAVFVSSGSTANQLIAQYVKDKLIESGQWEKRKKVIVSSVTWQTNVSVWVREGFEPVFLDVSLKDFCLDLTALEKYLQNNHESVAAVFPTAVLGYTPDITRLRQLESKYPAVKFALDACENFMGEYGHINLCAPFTSSTSCFIAHQINTGTEGGFIFTNSDEEYKYYLLSRAHGLKRNLAPYLDKLPKNSFSDNTNLLVDPQFDFQTLSSNYRSSDVAAFCGLLDFKRVGEYKQKRHDLYNLFYELIDHKKYYLPKQNRNGNTDVAFCLPIIAQSINPTQIQKVKHLLDYEGIERRSFISGNMLRQKPYQKYGNYKEFRNAEYLNQFAIYIGLPMNLEKAQVIALCEKLNKL
jgi:CDP-6-deoxy-D-xylo-4-hexulose-3-dehydrase